MSDSGTGTWHEALGATVASFPFTGTRVFIGYVTMVMKS
jgi:hypothetical protein